LSFRLEFLCTYLHISRSNSSQLAGVENLRCGHESHNQNSSAAKPPRQIAIFGDGVPYHAPVCRDLGEVCSINPDFLPRSLELRPAMKQIQIGQFDPARLLTYLLSRLVDTHSVEDASTKNGSHNISDERSQLVRSPTRAAGEMLKAAERRWPSRYY
jgi:hypothetical protein